MIIARPLDYGATGSFVIYNTLKHAPFNLDELNKICKEINQKAQYSYLSLSLRSYEDTTPLLPSDISNVIYVISKLPSVKALSLHGEFDSLQASEVIHHLAGTDIKSLFINSGGLKQNGMVEFAHSLAETNITSLSLQGKIQESALDSLSFKDTKIDYLEIRYADITGFGFSKLIAALEKSDINSLMFFDIDFSTDAIAMADFSKTNLSSLCFISSPLNDNDFMNLHIEGSNLNTLIFDSYDLSPKQMDSLSAKLVSTNIEVLEFTNCYFENNSLANLDLHNTSVKVIDFKYSIIDKAIFSSLDLENSSVEKINLLNTQISIEDSEFIQSMIRGTSIHEVQLGKSIIQPGQVVDMIEIIHNDSPRLSDTHLSSIQPKSSNDVLKPSDVFIQENDLIEKNLSENLNSENSTAQLGIESNINMLNTNLTYQITLNPITTETVEHHILI